MAEIRIVIDDAFLDDLKSKLGISKSSEVIQQALAMLNWGADNAIVGRDIMSADASRSDLEKVVLPGLANAKAKARSAG